MSNEVTVAAWVKKPAPSRDLHTLVSRQKGSDNQDSFLMGFGKNNLVFSSNVWGVRVLYPFPFGDRWVHVAGSRSADGTARLFINGEEVAHAMSRKMASIGGGNNGLFFGAGLNVPDPSRPTEILEGAMDEMAVYDRALSKDEIAALASGVQPAR